MSVDPPPNLPPRKKLAIERPLGGGAKNGRLYIYTLVTAVLSGLAAYNAFVEQLPLFSPYVVAPAIGAVWFGLRLFMIWGSNARG